MVYISNLYSCQHFFGIFVGKAVYINRHAQSARTRSKIAAHRRGREISPGIGRRTGAGRLPEPFAIHPGRHHRKIIARGYFPFQGPGFAAASNWNRDYLLPSNPAEVREKLNLFATMWSPTLAWLDNTYSAFSASASTIGILATAALFAAGLVVGFRRVSHASHMRITWLLLYVANWFILPKYEPCGWIGLGLLTAAASISEEPASEMLPAPATLRA